MDTLTGLISGTLVFTLTVAVITDIRAHKIYNALTIPALLLGFLLNGARAGGSGLLFSLEGLGVASVSLALLVIRSGLGAGDVKLLWAVGALMGPGFTLWTLPASALAGGLLGLGCAWKRGALAHTARNVLSGTYLLATARSTEGLPDMAAASRAGKMPYAPAIAIGAATAALLVHTGLIAA